jgi:protein-disulfide isomerase
MTERTPLPIIIFAGLIFIVLIMMFIAILPQRTVIFTDDDEGTKATIEDYDPVFGSTDASIIITHYSDFLCESCADVAQSLSRIAADYPEEVALVWKDFPNVSAHSLAPNASLAARCAGEQDAFWEYHDLLFAHQAEIIDSTTAATLFESIASELDLGSWRFNRCMNKQYTFEDMEASYEDALDLELISSPTISINDEWYTGIISESEIRSVILSLELTQ